MRIARIILIGSDRHKEVSPLCLFAEIASEIGFDVIVVLDSRRHSIDDSTCQTLRSLGVRFTLVDKFSLDLVRDFFHSETVALSVNSQWLFSKSEISYFDGQLFNYHSADLPRRRGKASHTWRYLENISRTSLTFHQIEARLDSGRKICERKVIDDMWGLQKFYTGVAQEERHAFLDFINALQTGNWKEQSKADPAVAEDFYWPGIDSKTQGYINWAWTSEEIVLMCKAMGDPHSGAKTFLEGKPVSILGAELLPGGATFHPYQAGLVIRVSKDFIVIAAKGSGVKIPKAMFVTEQEVKVGNKLRTPSRILEID